MKFFHGKNREIKSCKQLYLKLFLKKSWNQVLQVATFLWILFQGKIRVIKLHMYVLTTLFEVNFTEKSLNQVLQLSLNLFSQKSRENFSLNFTSRKIFVKSSETTFLKSYLREKSWNHLLQLFLNLVSR